MVRSGCNDLSGFYAQFDGVCSLWQDDLKAEGAEIERSNQRMENLLCCEICMAGYA